MSFRPEVKDRFLKKLLIGIVVLFGLAVAAVLVGPGFVDWNSYKGQIAQQAMALTGRAVQIDGDVSLQVVPAPELRAAQVRIANASQSIEAGAEADMARLEQLQVRVAFWPLLKGQIQVESVSLIEPTLLLEVYADGSNNWTFGAEDGTQASNAASDPRPSQREPAGARAFTAADDTLRIDRLSLRGATVIYRDAASGVEERLEALDADLAAESLSGPFSARGQVRLRGHDVEFETASGRWVEEGATQISTSLVLPRIQAKGQFSGTVSRHVEGLSLRGKLKLSGESLAAALQEFDLARGSIAALAKPFQLETEVSADQERAGAKDVVFTLGDSEVSGEIEVAHRLPRRARIDLNASRLDLDALLTASEAASAGAAVAEAPRQQNDSAPQSSGSQSSAVGGVESQPDEGFAIPADLEASIQVVVDAAIYRQQVLRQMLFSADVTDGRLVIGELAALLPGGSDFALSGVLSTPAAVPTFDGRLDGAADNLRGVLQWLGLDVGEIPADRLRKTIFSSRVTATPQLVTFSDIDLLMDVTRVNGGVSIAVRERPGLGIGLAVNRLDLDAYLPQDKRETAAPSAGDGAAVQPGGQSGASENAPPAQAGAAPDLSFLDSFDANLDLRIGSLSYQGALLRDLHLDGTLQAASLALRSLEIADLSGAALQASGQIDRLADAPSLNGRLALQVADPGRLAPLIGKAARDLEPLGAFSLDTALQGSLEALALDGRLSAQGGEASAAGQVADLLSDPTYDLTVTARHPEFNGLLQALGVSDGFRGGRGAFSLNGQLSGSTQSLRFSDLTLRAGSLSAQGRLAADFSSDVPQINLDLDTGEIRTADLKELKGVGSARSTSARAQNGSGRAAGSGAGRSGAATPQPGVNRGGADLNGVHRRWSRDPLDLSGLAQVDGEIVLRSQALVIDDLRLDEARIEANLNGGLLAVRNFEAGVYGGRVQATGTVDGRSTPAVNINLKAAGLNAGRLVRELADSDRISGALDVTASLNSRGASEAALVLALAGEGQLGGDLTARVKAEEQIGSAVLGILGDKIKEIRGVSDATTALFSAFAGAPAKLSGSFQINQGVVETVNTRLDGRNASIFTAGAANLPAWLLDSRSDLFRSQDSDQINPYVVAEVKGPLDEPNVRVAGRAFQRSKSGSSGSSSSGSSSPEKVKPEDVLRGLLRDLAR